MTHSHRLVALAVLAILAGCTGKDKEVLTGKGTAVDNFEIKPKTAAEMSASMAASSPPSALDSFHFKPKTAEEMSRTQARSGSTPPSALDNFKFVPRTAAEMSSSATGR